MKRALAAAAVVVLIGVVMLVRVWDDLVMRGDDDVWADE